VTPRIGIVGCGSIAKTHTRNLRSFGVNLGFSSRNKSSAEKLANKDSDKVYENFPAMLEDPGLGAVVICSPPEFHAEQVIQALKAGKLVLAEKPLCLNQEEMIFIHQVDESVGGALMIAENYYYKPSLIKLKTWLKEGVIGEVKSVSIRKVTKDSISGWKKNCGALIEGGIHFIALLTELAGSRALKVEAEFPGYSPETPEQHSLLKIEFANGVNGKLEFSACTPSITKGVFQHSRIQGTSGQIIFESNGLYAQIHTRSGKQRVVFPLKDLLGYRKMMEEFVVWVNDRTRTPFASLSRVQIDLQIVWDSYQQLPQRRHET